MYHRLPWQKMVQIPTFISTDLPGSLSVFRAESV